MKFESICTKIALKEGSLPRVREWAATLNSRPDEVLQTLADEGVALETVFLEKQGDQYFLVYFMKAASFEKARVAAQKSVHAIDQYHKEFKRDTWGTRTPLELLIDFDRIKELE